MKTAKLTFLFVSLAAAISACGGGGEEDVPPPPTNSPHTDQGRHDVLHLAQRTRRDCCSAVTPVFFSVASQVSSGGQIAPPPADINGCQQSSTQIMLSLQTLYPEGIHKYLGFLTAQARAMANCVGNALQSGGIPINPQTAQIFFATGAGILKSALPGANPLLQGVQQMAIQGLMQGR